MAMLYSRIVKQKVSRSRLRSAGLKKSTDQVQASHVIFKKKKSARSRLHHSYKALTPGAGVQLFRHSKELDNFSNKYDNNNGMCHVPMLTRYVACLQVARLSWYRYVVLAC